MLSNFFASTSSHLVLNGKREEALQAFSKALKGFFLGRPDNPFFASSSYQVDDGRYGSSGLAGEDGPAGLPAQERKGQGGGSHPLPEHPE